MDTDQDEFLLHVLKGNVEAAEFCGLIGEITQVIDDLYDGDKVVAPYEIERVFFATLVELPRNPFYARHFALLNPIMQAAFVAWSASNALEHGPAHDKSLAFVLRDKMTDLVVQCAWIVGGYEWARERAPAIYRYFMDETLEQFVEERA